MRKPDSDQLKKAGYGYWRLGLNVVPLAIVEGKGEWKKRPLVKWKKWVKTRQTQQEFQRLPWDNCEGFAIIIDKLKHGTYLCCVDYDTKHIESQKVLQLGRKVLEKLPKTRTESTINGGLHTFLLCREQPITESKYHKFCGVELLGVGKLCAMYPSLGYDVPIDLPITEIKNANELFEEIVEKSVTKIVSAKTWFGRPERKRRYRGRHPPCVEKLLNGVPEGKRNETCIRLASYLRNFRGLIQKTSLLRLREWNEKNQPPLTEEEIMRTLKSAEEHQYVYGCNDPIFRSHCKDGCPLSSRIGKKQDILPLELIEKELKNAKTIRLHPLIDFHPALGYSVGLILDEDKVVQIVDKKVKTFDIEALIPELPNSTPVQVKELKFLQVSPKCKEAILKLAKDLIKGNELENRPKEDLFGSVLEKIWYYWYHSDRRWYIFATCFIIATYYHRMFPIFAHWVLQGVRKSGKTTMALLMNNLAWNPTKPQSGLRTAPLFRSIEDSRPTFLIDVTRFNPKDADLNDMLEIIEPQGVVSRCVGEQKDEIKHFHPFSPKVLMVRQTVTFSDKSIVCVTEPAPKGSQYTERRIYIASDPDMKETVGELIRSVVCNWKLVHEAYRTIKQDRKLFGRRFELWRPFLAICKAYCPELYPDMLNLAYEDMEETEKGDVTSDVENALLGYFLKCEKEKLSAMFLLKDLTSELQSILSKQVVKSYHIVKSAVKNLRLTKKRTYTNQGVKYQINLKRARELAEERGIKIVAPGEHYHIASISDTHNFCHLCEKRFVEGQPITTWHQNWVHVPCAERAKALIKKTEIDSQNLSTEKHKERASD